MNSSDLESRLVEVVEDAHHKARIPGLSVAVSVEDERAAACVGTAAVGSGVPMAPTARFQIGCITKLLTCVIAMQLVHEGKLDLDGAIADYLPEFAAVPIGRDIRIRHLATHTSGYRGLNPSNPAYGYFYSWPKFVEFLRNTEQVFRPGSVFNYEHTESVVLGEVIRRVSGSSSERLILDFILQPLQLATGTIERDAGRTDIRVANHSLDRDSGQYVAVRSVPYCNFWASSLSSITASAVDLVTIGQVLGGLRNVPGISRPAVEHAMQPVVEIPPSWGEPEREVSPRSFGFGWAHYPKGLVGHNGSARGQTCGLRFSRRHGMVAVVALNCWDPCARDSLLDSVFRALLPEALVESEATRTQSKLTMEELEGTYRGCVQDVEILVTRRENRLLCAIGGLAGGGAQKLVVEMTVNESGEPRVRCPVRHLSVGFFREEDTGIPAMLVGLNAFRKVDVRGNRGAATR